MRQRLEEKNRLIEKKTQAVLQAQQERNRMNTELTELKDHMDIKDRKINVLQRKVGFLFYYLLSLSYFHQYYYYHLNQEIFLHKSSFIFISTL